MGIVKNTVGIKDYLVYGFGQVINLIAPLLIAPFIIAKCGIENFGKVGVATSIFTLLALFIEFGSNILGVKEISSNKNDSIEIRRYLNLSFSFKIIALLLIAFTTILVIFIIDIKEKSLYILGLSMLIAQLFNTTWVLQGLEQFTAINKLIFFSKILYLLLVYVLIKHDTDYIYVLFLLGISNTLVYSFFFFKIYRFFKLSLFSFNFNVFKKFVKNESSILLSNLSISVYCQFPILIVQYLLGDYFAGIYKIGDMILSVFRSYLGVFFNVSFPKFCSICSKSELKGMLLIKKINLINILLLSIGVVVVVMFEIVILFVIQVDTEIRDLIVYYTGFIIIPIIIAVNIPFYQFLLYKNEQKALSKIFFSGVLIMMFSCFLGTYKYRLIGTLAAVFFTESLISFLKILYCFMNYNEEIKTFRMKIERAERIGVL